MTIKLPSDLRKVLAAAPKAKAQWDDLTPIARLDFISWIEAAKRPETRKIRVDSVPSRLASGKRRPCCYAVVPMEFYTALGTQPKAKAQWKELTPLERRVFIAWVGLAKGREDKQIQVAKACARLAAGKRTP